jgi:hypothetical protein
VAHPQLEHEAKIYAKLKGGGNSLSLADATEMVV